MIAVIVSIVFGFVTMILASVVSSYIHNHTIKFTTTMDIKEILASLIYFLSGALFVAHLFIIKLDSSLWIYIPVQLVVLIGLIYLAIWDIHTLTIPSVFTNLFLLLVVIINFVVGLSSYIEYSQTGLNTLINLPLGTLGNMVSGLLLGGVIFLVHKFTKGKGIGDGDIYIYATIGFALGFPLGISFLIIASLFGGLVAFALIVIFWNKRERILKTKIPLMPVILIGYVLTLVLQNQLYLMFGL